jgi:hypothetical protein
MDHRSEPGIDYSGRSQQAPDGHVSVPPHTVSRPSPLATRWSPPRTPCFSTASANVGRRRYQRSSMLLSSPPRPGHFNRMSQLFRRVGVPNRTAIDDESVLYPQLPNISRVSLPLRRDQTRLPAEKAYTSTSESSSESWSDDSGYIIDDPAPSLVGSGAPAQRIEDWLARLSYDEGAGKVVGAKRKPRYEEEPAQDPFLDTKLQMTMDTNHIETPRSETHISSAPRPDQKLSNGSLALPINPFDCSRSSTSKSATSTDDSNHPSPLASSQRHVSDMCRRLFFDLPRPTTGVCITRSSSTSKAHGCLGLDPTADRKNDVELSPLSPNVCIERGPSRYHSAHKTRSNTSPSKAPTLTSFFTPPRYSGEHMKENIICE